MPRSPRKSAKSPKKVVSPKNKKVRSPKSKVASPKGKVVNPETGRMINKGGAVYNNLVFQGKIQDKAVSAKITKQLSAKRTTVKQIGALTSGWAAEAPRKGAQRRAMAAACGSECFLDPQNEGFPVCSIFGCNPTCKGINAAYNRARQYGHEGIAQKAKKLQEAYHCK